MYQTKKTNIIQFNVTNNTVQFIITMYLSYAALEPIYITQHETEDIQVDNLRICTHYFVLIL